ncbi:hypothetical protein [Moorena sp. SIO4G3]|uniref:hypothetical protein n=1 Tax=Moorena sp. SIO4G3 TaxID=2607821 RepID=UPI00142C0538|nr:hypothetical protein [Moorena sp. SIO4G3]NEO80984.1 hypothetical protein [Moorena sp. SIO4G3]
MSFGASTGLILATNLSSDRPWGENAEQEVASWVKFLLEKLSDRDSSAFWGL